MIVRHILTALAVSTGLGLSACPATAQVDNNVVIGSWSCSGYSSVGIGTHTATVNVERSGRMTFFDDAHDTYSQGDTYESTTNAEGTWYFTGNQLIFRQSSVKSCFRGRCQYDSPRTMRFNVTDDNLYLGNDFCSKESGPNTYPGESWRRYIRPNPWAKGQPGGNGVSPSNPSSTYSPPPSNQDTFRQRHSLRSRMEIMNDIHSVEADIARCERNSDANVQHNMGTWYNTMCASQVASDRARLGALQGELSAADH